MKKKTTINKHINNKSNNDNNHANTTKTRKRQNV